MSEQEIYDLRRERLTREIDRLNEFFEEMRQEPEGVMDLVEIVEVGRDSVRVLSFDDIPYDSVFLPDDIMSLVEPGDVFMMSLVPCKRGWQIDFISPPYEPCDCNEDDLEDEMLQ